MVYYEVPLYLDDGKFHAASPEELTDGWDTEYDLIQHMAINGFREISTTLLKHTVVGVGAYHKFRLYSNANNTRFAATAALRST